MFELLLFDSIFAANELFNPGCRGTYSTCTNTACENSTDKLKCYS